MSEKQSLLLMAGALPENATWADITDALLTLVVHRGSAADFARLYKSQLTSGDLAEYESPKGVIPLDSVIEELERRPVE